MDQHTECHTEALKVKIARTRHNRDDLLTILLRFDCDMLLACPLLVELGPAWESMGLCWEDPCPPAAMPFVAERGGTEAFPGGWLDIVLDTMDDRLYLVDVLAEDIPKKIHLII